MREYFLFGEISVIHYLTLTSILFVIGVCGVILNRRSAITLLMSIELMILSVSMNFVIFSSHLNDISGQIFSIFILTVAAAEAAIGLAILVIYFRAKKDIDVSGMDQLKG